MRESSIQRQVEEMKSAQKTENNQREMQEESVVTQSQERRVSQTEVNVQLCEKLLNGVDRQEKTCVHWIWQHEIHWRLYKAQFYFRLWWVLT